MLIAIAELFLLALCAAVPTWWFLGPDCAVLSAFIVVVVFSVLMAWKVRRLEHWLAGSDLRGRLDWKGVWLEIGQRVQRLLQQREKTALDHKKRLQDFLLAIQASPNGVTLLDEQGRIEWCNGTASSHLGLDLRRDHLQHIVHLVRDPVFSKYFQQLKYSSS